MGKRVIFCFSGQGSQYYQMGKILWDEDPAFRESMARLDAILGSLGQASIIEELYAPERKISQVFDRLLQTHPAVFMVQYSLYRSLRERGLVPDALMGASLGEFVAATAAGVLSEEDAMALVLKNAELVEGECPRGGMIAILAPLGLFDELKAVWPDIELCAVNSDRHFVIAGPESTLESLLASHRGGELLLQALPVSRAFHSRQIAAAEAKFLSFLDGIEIKDHEIPLISCVDAAPLPDRLGGEYFWRVCRQPIRIRDALKTAESLGPSIYVDLGPSGSFANFVVQNYGKNPPSGSESVTLMTPFCRDGRLLDTISQLCARLTQRSPA